VSLHTALCGLLGVLHPVLNAPMAGSAGAGLASIFREWG
jgi:NAD(P)H-dependent flavin oxidoreductase YrpB (nitropropane dioxygenase family)